MLKITDYSDKSIAVVGEGTKKHKDSLKELGGKYNSNLRGGAGWIFSKKSTEEVQEFLKSIGKSAEINSEKDEESDAEQESVDLTTNFCSSLSYENISDARKVFTQMNSSAQKLFLHWGWEILSHKSKYSEDSYAVAYKLFRLFRGREGSSVPSYEKYSKMPLVNKLYSQASEWFKAYSKRVSSPEREEKVSRSRSRSTSSRSSRSTSSRSRSSRSTSSRSRSSRSRSASRSRSRAGKKYDKEYQKYVEPESEIDPLYIYYTTLFRERPKSKLAIVWLTEHGVFEDDQRDELVEKYKKIKG